MVSTSAILAYSLLLSGAVIASPAPLAPFDSAAAIAAAPPFVLRATKHDGFAPSRNHAHKKAKRSSRCPARQPSSSSSLLSSSSAAPTTAPGGVGAAPTTGSSTTPTKTTSEQTSTTTKASGGSGGGSGGGGNGKPSNWPTVTQSGPTYSATAASPSDPYLNSISDALNFDSVADYNKVQSGDMTYYETGQVACGDFYTDDTFTAAVSHELWDAWPGSDGDTDRSTICGPYVTGRQILNTAGGYTSVSKSSEGSIIIGGDGMPNCQSGVGLEGQCHIPMTATITNPANGKQAVVKIVDKCGGCAGYGDIDVTPSVFEYLSDINLGRVPVTWKFNHF